MARPEARMRHSHSAGDNHPVSSRSHDRPLSPDEMLRLILTSRVYDVAQETPLDPAPRLSRRLNNDVATQARGPAADLQLQAARCIQPDRASDRRGAHARRHRGQRRQPRAGGRVRGTPSGPRRADRDAADHARDQGGRRARSGRRGRARRRQLRRRAGAVPRACRRNGA